MVGQEGLYTNAPWKMSRIRTLQLCSLGSQHRPRSSDFRSTNSIVLEDVHQSQDKASIDAHVRPRCPCHHLLHSQGHLHTSDSKRSRFESIRHPLQLGNLCRSQSSLWEHISDDMH